MQTTSSGQKTTDSLNGKLAFEQDKNRIVGRDENNLIRLLILANGIDFVMKVSKDGFDALTATDDQLIFNSDRNVFKITEILQGSIAVNFGSFSAGGSDGGFSASSTNELVLTHGLGYVPAILVYMYDTSTYVPITNGSFLKSPGFTTTNPSVTFQGTTTGGMATAYWSISVDSSAVTIKGMRSGWTRAGVTVAGITFPSASMRVYCLQETAN